jgi:hypothetical protein
MVKPKPVDVIMSVLEPFLENCSIRENRNLKACTFPNYRRPA